jgi:glycosyltransferase involved in cell wall biosynthesis
MKPKVTIGVCVKNSESTIKDAIESILAQDFPHEQMEVIFVDDGSKDKTLSIIADNLPRMDMQTRVYYGQWKGLGKTRNLVVDNASGDYIIWVDGDTILKNDYIIRHVEFMEKHPRVGIATGRFSIRDNEHLVAFLEHIGFEAVNVKHCGISEKLPGTAGAAYRLKSIKQVGGFDETITGAGEDTDAAYRIRKSGWLIYQGIGGNCFTKRKQTWSALWKQYLWHGYGYHYIYSKNKHIGKLWALSPPIAIVSGFLNSFVAYKLTRRKSVFLLPLQFFFKMSAWWIGFTKSHLRSYKTQQDFT